MLLTKEIKPVERLTPPEGFIPPPLNPAGVVLETRKLADGVYALLSSKPPVDNGGFVVGARGVLVIDAGISDTMAGRIQDAVREVTAKPILYLVNTNFHGDHTFGNYSFPEETKIVSHWITAERMRDFSAEKEFLLGMVDGDTSVFGDSRLRLPDITFEDYMRLNLGERIVELHYFGPGNTPGDVVVYLPESKIAWTGNLVLGDGSIPFLLEGDAGGYLETIAHFERALDVEAIVPGHGDMTSGLILGRYLRYLSELIDSLRMHLREGHSLEQTLESLPLGKAFTPRAESSFGKLDGFSEGLHRYNVKAIFEEARANSEGLSHRAGGL